ncbi:mitochondrial Homoaconitase [Aspergillus fumigatus]
MAETQGRYRITDRDSAPIRRGAYAKYLYLIWPTLSPYVSGLNSVKVATLDELEKHKLKIDKAYLVSCTNSRASDIAAAASAEGRRCPDGWACEGRGRR